MITTPICDDMAASGMALGGPIGETAELYAAAAELAIAAIGRQCWSCDTRAGSTFEALSARPDAPPGCAIDAILCLQAGVAEDGDARVEALLRRLDRPTPHRSTVDDWVTDALRGRWDDLGPLKAYLAGGAQRHPIDTAAQRKEMSRGGPSIAPTFGYCRCGGRVLKHSWPGGKPGPQHAKKRWCSACGLADAELVEREFPGLAGAELNAALRRWQREEEVAGKQYQALLLLARSAETAERYAPVVPDAMLVCVMRTLIAA